MMIMPERNRNQPRLERAKPGTVRENGGVYPQGLARRERTHVRSLRHLRNQNEYFNENCTNRGVPLLWVISPMAGPASTFAFPVNCGF